MESLNEPGVTYTHAALAERNPEPGREPAPLCGFSAGGEAIVPAETGAVDCRDCLAAL